MKSTVAYYIPNPTPWKSSLSSVIIILLKMTEAQTVILGEVHKTEGYKPFVFYLI